MAVDAAPVTGGQTSNQQQHTQAGGHGGAALPAWGPISGHQLNKLLSKHRDPADLAKVILESGREDDAALWTAIHHKLGNQAAQQIIQEMHKLQPPDPLEVAVNASRKPPTAGAGAASLAAAAPTTAAPTTAPPAPARVVGEMDYYDEEEAGAAPPPAPTQHLGPNGVDLDKAYDGVPTGVPTGTIAPKATSTTTTPTAGTSTTTPTSTTGATTAGAAADAAPLAPSDVTTSPINHDFLGVRIMAPAGVKISAIDRCESFLSEELGKNLYAQQKMQKAKVAIAIMPAATKMTDMPEFKSLKGQKTFDGRDWDNVRGSGGTLTPDGYFAIAVGEEDLSSVKTVIGTPYSQGYSVGGHELAHSIEAQGLNAEQHNRVIALWAARNAKDPGNKLGTWTDTYASSNEKEYFAQATVTFFGHNDMGTNHNGREWLQANDPDMYTLLVEIYETNYDKKGNVVK